MNTFKDKSGREWIIRINYASIERVMDSTGFNLLLLADPKQSQQLDGLKLLRILYALCLPQAESAKLSYEDFREGLEPDEVEVASTLIMEGLVSFSPSRLRPVLNKMQIKRTELEAAALTRLEAFLDQTSNEVVLAELDKALIHSVLRRGSIEKDTNTAASSD